MASLPPPLPVTRPADRTPTRDIARGRAEPVLLTASGLVTIVAAFLPWAALSASFFAPVRTAGVEGDGRLTLVFGIGLALVGTAGLAWPGRRTGRTLLGLVLAIAVTAVALVNVADVRSAAGPLSPEARALVDLSVGRGLWLTLLAGLGAVGTAVAALLARPPELRRS